VNPPQNDYGVRGYAMNVDGTKIAVVSGQQATFLDRSFNVLGTTQVPYGFPSGRSNVMFTPDGNRLLVQYALPLAIEVLDASQYVALGYYSGSVSPEDNMERLLAVDSSSRAFVGIAGGVRVIDMTAPMMANPPNDSLSGTWCPLPSTIAAPLNTSERSGFASTYSASDGMSYYFGGQPASLLSNGTQIDIPASSTAGGVDLECIGPDGNTLVYSVAYSYGVGPVGVSANLVPPTGNPSLYVFGFGFSGSPSISIGGQSVTTLAVSAQNPFQLAQVRVPNGTPGGSATVAVSSANGSGSLAQAVNYIPSASIVPSSGLLQVLYDAHRNLVYALKSTEVDVLNPTTLQWRSPFPIPGAGGSVTYNTMALSPDGSRLAVGSPNGYVAVIDPDNPSQAASVATNSTPGFQSGSIAVSKYNKAIVTGNPNVEVDLSNLKVTPLLSIIMADLVRASADGASLYGVALNVSSGQTFSIDPITYAVYSSPHFGHLFYSDLAVSADGTQFAGIIGAPYLAGDIVGLYDQSMNVLNFTVYPLVSPPDDTLVLGSTFSPQGKVVMVPLGDSIEFWDTATGTLRARLMTPEELKVFSYPEGPVSPQIALDAIGQTIFAISASGLTVMKLAQTVDNLPVGPWAGSRQAAGQSHGFSSITTRMRATRIKKLKSH
jgi:WD40 repeat protein